MIIYKTQFYQISGHSVDFKGDLLTDWGGGGGAIN